MYNDKKMMKKNINDINSNSLFLVCFFFVSSQILVFILRKKNREEEYLMYKCLLFLPIYCLVLDKAIYLREKA